MRDNNERTNDERYLVYSWDSQTDDSSTDGPLPKFDGKSGQNIAEYKGWQTDEKRFFTSDSEILKKKVEFFVKKGSFAIDASNSLVIYNAE